MEWYFRSCTQCASLAIVVDGKLCCKKYSECKSAVPRYKLHVIVMDDTGSTNFVLFDRNATQLIGRNAQDLINDMEKAKKEDEYPADFNTLMDKEYLFKMEVGEGNVSRKYRNYVVKKVTDDADAIAEFVSKYNLKDQVSKFKSK